MRRGLLAVISTVIALSSTTAAVGAAEPDAHRSAPAPLRYVAMGDSYSAASGVLPPDPNAFPGCLRSTNNYANVISRKVDVKLTDVTCSGADTSDYFTSQYDGVPRQLAALSKNTQLITMTIGGNDSGVFVNSMAECGAAGLQTAGQGHPCKDKYGGSFKRTTRNKTYPSLVKTLKAVHKRSPRAEVAIAGYPWILPKAKGCFPKMPVAKGDVPYLRYLQWTLNDAVKRAAAATGTTYVNLNQVSDGHDACKPIGTRWVEPVLEGTNPVIVHPNALGEARIAGRVLTVLGLR